MTACAVAPTCPVAASGGQRPVRSREAGPGSGARAMPPVQRAGRHSKESWRGGGRNPQKAAPQECSATVLGQLGQWLWGPRLTRTQAPVSELLPGAWALADGASRRPWRTSPLRLQVPLFPAEGQGPLSPGPGSPVVRTARVVSPLGHTEEDLRGAEAAAGGKPPWSARVPAPTPRQNVPPESSRGPKKGACDSRALFPGDFSSLAPLQAGRWGARRSGRSGPAGVPAASGRTLGTWLKGEPLPYHHHHPPPGIRDPDHVQDPSWAMSRASSSRVRPAGPSLPRGPGPDPLCPPAPPPPPASAQPCRLPDTAAFVCEGCGGRNVTISAASSAAAFPPAAHAAHGHPGPVVTFQASVAASDLPLAGAARASGDDSEVGLGPNHRVFVVTHVRGPEASDTRPDPEDAGGRQEAQVLRPTLRPRHAAREGAAGAAERPSEPQCLPGALAATKAAPAAGGCSGGDCAELAEGGLGGTPEICVSPGPQAQAQAMLPEPRQGRLSTPPPVPAVPGATDGTRGRHQAPGLGEELARAALPPEKTRELLPEEGGSHEKRHAGRSRTDGPGLDDPRAGHSPAPVQPDPGVCASAAHSRASRAAPARVLASLRKFLAAPGGRCSRAHSGRRPRPTMRREARPEQSASPGPGPGRSLVTRCPRRAPLPLRRGTAPPASRAVPAGPAEGRKPGSLQTWSLGSHPLALSAWAFPPRLPASERRLLGDGLGPGLAGRKPAHNGALPVPGPAALRRAALPGRGDGRAAGLAEAPGSAPSPPPPPRVPL
ncbi:collagen alpha-1(I) chain-like [Phyllostomus hastatus]|uniref:collagen alpha-1(I) chain-like n=1 Tax=Phyllostomus hastatus TaxID=9423 RepID=UPI001E67E00A|nr:collagen alpha-1(I) chain-like [Phyllostomus hastatus]